MIIAVFWDADTVRVVAVSSGCTMMMEAVRSSQQLVNTNHITWCYIPEDSYHHTRHPPHEPQISPRIYMWTQNIMQHLKVYDR